MPGRMTPLVEAVRLDKRYVDGPTVVRVLEELDLTVGAGDRIAIVGDSGVGKSTLLHLLGGLDRPSGGHVLFDGDDIFTRTDAELAAFRNRTLGFVFQFHHLLGDFTALENVMLPGLIARQPVAAVRARALTLLERVGLQERLVHRPAELSGGGRVVICHGPVRRLVARAVVVGVVVTATPLAAQGERSIARVSIAGNLRVEEDAIRVHLRSQPGQPFDQETLDRDVRAVYAMG